MNSQRGLTVNLRLDAARLFTGLHPVQSPWIGAPSRGERAIVSDSFANGFSLTSVENPQR